MNTLKNSLRKGLLIPLILLILLIFSINFNTVSASIQVNTDKDTYNRGDTVTFTVTGATPSGIVILELHDPDDDVVWLKQGNANSNGELTKTLPMPSNWDLGVYTIYAKDHSSGQTDTDTFTVREAPRVASVSLTADKTEVSVDESVKFTATVKDQYGSLMKNKKVTLVINETSYAFKYTGSDGKAIFTVSFDDGGVYDVYAKADSKTSSHLLITVSKPPSELTSVTIAANSTHILQTQSITFTVTTLDQFSDPMPDILIHLYVDDNEYSSERSDSNGEAVFVVPFNSAGAFYVHASAEGIDSESLLIIVEEYTPPSKPSYVELTSNTTEVAVEEYVSFTVYVADQYNEPMANVEVSLYLNDVYHSANTTDEDGLTTFTVQLYTVGQFKFNAKAGSIFSPYVTINVSPPPQRVSVVMLGVDKTTVYTGESATFTVTVIDQFGEAVPNKLVSLYINDELYDTIMSNQDGHAFFTVPFGEEGAYTVYAVCEEVTSNEITITVQAPPPPPMVPWMYVILGVFIVMTILLALIFVKIWRERTY